LADHEKKDVTFQYGNKVASATRHDYKVRSTDRYAN